MPDPNGPTRNLSSEQRFSSIQLAVNYADPDDTIVIEPGVYGESIVLNRDITLQSPAPHDPYYVGGTIIQASLDEPVVTLDSNSSSCVLAGLTLHMTTGRMPQPCKPWITRCLTVDNGDRSILGDEPAINDSLVEEP